MLLVRAVRQGTRPAIEFAREAAIDNGVSLAGVRKALGLDRSRCTALLPSGDYQLIQTEAPGVPREEWREALRWRLKDFLDYPGEEAVYDVADIPTEQHAPGRQRQCFVVAARRQTVAQRLAGLLAGKIRVEAVDVPEMAQRNLAALFEEENRGLACLAFDDGGGLLTVSFQGELYASRRIDVPAAQFEGADEGRRQQLFERISLETQRTLDAFDRQYSFMTVKRLMLAPHPALAGLQDALARNLYLPVEDMDLGQVLDLEKCPELAPAAAQSRFFHAIGAALREEGP